MVGLEKILEPHNLTEALKQVVSNKGTPGVDGMAVDELESFIRANPGLLSHAIRDGSYRPSPVKRVYIPKDNGDKRPLGIPTVVDRLIQQAIAQQLSEEYEPKFSDNSFGFRPNRSAHDALKRIVDNANEGYEYVIDLDLAKFFDTVNHSKMIQVLSETVKDGRVVSLVHKFFRAKINEDGKITKPTMGMPQGGPLSPVCANILLNELDQLLDSRGHRYVRYADDMLLQFRSQRSAERVFTSVKKFIEEKLFLQVNVEKTKICHLSKDVKFLGHTFFKRKNDEDVDGKGKWRLAVHRKARKAFEQKIKALLNRKCSKGLDRCKEELRLYIRGWANYFHLGLSKVRRENYDQWIRRRIRQLYWKIWKKNPTRVRALIKLGIEQQRAYEWGNSSKSYWRVSGSWVLTRSLKNDVLQMLGWTWLGTARQWSA